MNSSNVALSHRLHLGAALTWGLIIASPAAAAGDEPAPAERVAVGQEAPGFSLTGTDGESYAPGDLRGEKYLVLIFFRGTW